MHFYDIKLATERVKYQAPVSRFIRRKALLSKSKAELQNVSEGCTTVAWLFELFPWCDIAHGDGAQGFMSDLKVPTYKLDWGVCLSGECWLSASM
jgi:hypothetical protein